MDSATQHLNNQGLEIYFKYLRFISFDFNIRYQLRSKKLLFLTNLTLHSVTQRKGELSVTLTPMQPIFGQSLNTEERLPHGQGQPRFQGLSSSRFRSRLPLDKSLILQQNGNVI